MICHTVIMWLLPLLDPTATSCLSWRFLPSSSCQEKAAIHKWWRDFIVTKFVSGFLILTTSSHSNPIKCPHAYHWFGQRTKELWPGGSKLARRERCSQMCLRYEWAFQIPNVGRSSCGLCERLGARRVTDDNVCWSLLPAQTKEAFLVPPSWKWRCTFPLWPQ